MTGRKRKFTDADVITELNLLSPDCGKSNSCGENEQQPKKKSLVNRAESWKSSELRKALLNFYSVTPAPCAGDGMGVSASGAVKTSNARAVRFLARVRSVYAAAAKLAWRGEAAQTTRPVASLSRSRSITAGQARN